MGVPIHCAASEPDIEVLWIAARPASNAATQASRVSRRVPSTSNRTARSRATSGLLLPEPPDLVANVVDRLDRLALLLAGHRRAVHDRAPDRERTAVLLVPDPDHVGHPNPGIRIHDPRRHHVGPVVDEADRPHVDGHGTLRRRPRYLFIEQYGSQLDAVRSERKSSARGKPGSRRSA